MDTKKFRTPLAGPFIYDAAAAPIDSAIGELRRRFGWPATEAEASTEYVEEPELEDEKCEYECSPDEYLSDGDLAANEGDRLYDLFKEDLDG